MKLVSRFFLFPSQYFIKALLGLQQLGFCFGQIQTCSRQLGLQLKERLRFIYSLGETVESVEALPQVIKEIERGLDLIKDRFEELKHGWPLYIDGVRVNEGVLLAFTSRESTEK